jgi:UDP-glucose:(heptosyl)LPS alpha-1,3-glucosyltransferase
MGADDVVAQYGKPMSQVRVIRNGVDSERFRPDEHRRERAREAWNVPEGGRVALFLGNGFVRKGLRTAANAFMRVASPSDRFVVIGGDSHEARERAHLLEILGGRLVFQGPAALPERWLPGADATVLPTAYDAAANTTLEAMACGVPPVTTARDGNAERVPDPRLVVRAAADVDAVASALHHAWERGGAIAPALRQVALDWPVSRNGEAMEDLYRELIHENDTEHPPYAE